MIRVQQHNRLARTMPTGVRQSSMVSAITKQLQKPVVPLVRNTEVLNQVSYNTALRVAFVHCILSVLYA